MLQDTIRTSAYHDAILMNTIDFRDKVVVDVGAGSGILSFFAARAGARKVYSIEASKSSSYAQKLANANGLSNCIEVLQGKVEDIELPEKADVIVSEPMGVFLLHERMIESYLLARQKWLKPGGKMFPTNSNVWVAPFTDEYLHREQTSKTQFWVQTDFYGLDMSCLLQEAIQDHFIQPVVGVFDPSILVAEAQSKQFPFDSLAPEDLHSVDFEFVFTVNRTCLVHGLAGWFDVHFLGSARQSILSTSPYSPWTHWHQVRFLLIRPVAVNAGQRISARLSMRVNDQRSYSIEMVVRLEGLMDTEVISSNIIDLHQQFYHYLSTPQTG